MAEHINSKVHVAALVQEEAEHAIAVCKYVYKSKPSQYLHLHPHPEWDSGLCLVCRCRCRRDCHSCQTFWAFWNSIAGGELRNPIYHVATKGLQSTLTPCLIWPLSMMIVNLYR